MAEKGKLNDLQQYIRPIPVDQWTCLREDNELFQWAPSVSSGNQTSGVTINLTEENEKEQRSTRNKVNEQQTNAAKSPYDGLPRLAKRYKKMAELVKNLPPPVVEVVKNQEKNENDQEMGEKMESEVRNEEKLQEISVVENNDDENDENDE